MGDGCEGLIKLDEVLSGGGGLKQWWLETVSRRASRGQGCGVIPIEEQI